LESVVGGVPEEVGGLAGAKALNLTGVDEGAVVKLLLAEVMSMSMDSEVIVA